MSVCSRVHLIDGAFAMIEAWQKYFPGETT